jgi:hypothetical protein
MLNKKIDSVGERAASATLLEASKYIRLPIIDSVMDTMFKSYMSFEGDI